MKRYMLFGMDKYDCQGGINDFIKDFHELKDVKDFLLLQRISRDWWDIVDIKTGTHYEFLADKNLTCLTEIVNCKYGSYELLKILTLKKYNKDIRRMLYEKCSNNCKYKFVKLLKYYE